MKIPLCLCTIWSSIYTNLYDGRNLIEDRSLDQLDQYVGTIGGLNVSYQTTFCIHCAGPCRIKGVHATLAKGGDLRLIGYHGKGDNRFCLGGRTHGTGIANCQVWEYKELFGARIYIYTYNKCHNMSLTVIGENLIKLSDEPQSFQDQLLSVVYDAGSIIPYQETSYWILCRGPCVIEKVEVRNGNGSLYGEYGEYRETFCFPIFYDGIGECEMLKKTEFSRPQINMECYFGCDKLVLTVLGLNLIKIFDKPPSPKKITIPVGTLDKNQYMEFTSICTGGACILGHISVTFNNGGDVRMTGPIKNAIDSYYPNTFGDIGPKKCPELIENPSFTLYGHEKSENVTVTFTGPYLERVDHVRTWYTRQP